MRNDHDLAESADPLESPKKAMSIGLLIGAVVLVIALSVSLSTLIALSMKDDTVYVTPAELEKVNARLSQIETTLAEREKQLDLVIKAIPALNERIQNSSGVQMQKLMLEQERSIQTFLKNLKSGMYDLAHMIPGSRTWLEQYNDEMNKAIEESIKRSRELTRLNTGKVLIEPVK